MESSNKVSQFKEIILKGSLFKPACIRCFKKKDAFVLKNDRAILIFFEKFFCLSFDINKLTFSDFVSLSLSLHECITYKIPLVNDSLTSYNSLNFNPPILSLLAID